MNASSILVASSVFLLQSAVNPELNPWLLTVEEFNPGKLFVRAPFSRVVSKQLPVRLPYNLDLSHLKVLELGRFYTLRRLDRPLEMFSEKRLSEYDNKVVLFVNPNCVTCPTIDDCTLVELYDQVDHLSVTRLKHGGKQHVYFRGREFDDVVNFKGRIYAVDFEGIACSMDYHSLEMLNITWDNKLRSNYKKRLVVSCGELYVVFRRREISDYEGAFKVFKLNEEKEKWEEMKGIGDDKILFVTFDGCFVASVRDFPGWRGNCIVFRRGSFPEYSGIRSFDSKIFEGWQVHLDVAVFHFENGDCMPLEAYPRYRAVIWPPPLWIWKR